MSIATTTTSTQRSEKSIAVTPTASWTPLPIEGEIPPAYKTPEFGFEVIPLHPSFGCQVKGVDFSRRITVEEASEIRAVADKVSQSVMFPGNSDIGISMESSSSVIPS